MHLNARTRPLRQQATPRNTAANSSPSSTGMRPTLMMSSVGGCRDPSYTAVCLRPRFIIDRYLPAISFAHLQAEAFPRLAATSQLVTTARSRLIVDDSKPQFQTSPHSPHHWIRPHSSLFHLPDLIADGQRQEQHHSLVDFHLRSIRLFNARCIAPEYRYVLEILPQGLLARVNTERLRPAESGSSLLHTTCTQPANSPPQLQPRSSRRLVHQHRIAVGGFGASSMPSLRAALIQRPS